MALRRFVGQKGTSSLTPGGDSVPEELSICGPSCETPEDSLCPIRVIAMENNAGQEERALHGGRRSGRASGAAGASPPQTGPLVGPFISCFPLWATSVSPCLCLFPPHYPQYGNYGTNWGTLIIFRNSHTGEGRCQAIRGRGAWSSSTQSGAGAAEDPQTLPALLPLRVSAPRVAVNSSGSQGKGDPPPI